jgi:putative DNA primase/helicase
MPHPFSPTQIRFDGYGIDPKRAVWIRFRTGQERGSPSVIVPVADLNTGSPDIWRDFGNLGLLVSQADRKAILAKVQLFSGSYRFKVVNSIGWSLGYVTPNKVFGGLGDIVERQFGDLDLVKYRSSGKLEDWQTRILPLCTGNSRLMFAILCALAGPLLEILGIGSFGFQLFGDSSIGKTIVLIVAGSVWGCRVGAAAQQGFCEKWATTLEGVERFGRSHNDGFGTIDDTRLAGTDRDVGKLIAPFIMRLAEGVAKNRAVAIDAGGDWRLVYLGSSNLSFAEIFLAAGLVFDDAYRVRFPDIPADAGKGYGVFEDIHGFVDSEKFANELHARATMFFGTASEHFLEQLANDRDSRSAWLRSGLQHEMARYRRVYPARSGADGRISDHFATLFATGMLAQHYGVVRWSDREIAWAVRRCERAHQDWAGHTRAKLDPVAAIRSYIRQNTFRNVPDPSITDQDFPTIPGFVYTPPGKGTEYVFAPPVFERLVARFGSRRALSDLDAAGFLVRTGDKYVSKVPIRNSTADGRKFVYRVRGSILETK